MQIEPGLFVFSKWMIPSKLIIQRGYENSSTPLVNTSGSSFYNGFRAAGNSPHVENKIAPSK